MFNIPYDHRPLSIMKRKWKYRGEGNANLVLALPEDQVILRLHKMSIEEMNVRDVEIEEMNRVCLEAYFCQTVMVPLLGRAYIQTPVVARVQQSEIHPLDRLLYPKRPNFRHHKGIALGFVNIYPDYALLPDWLTDPLELTPTSNSRNTPTMVCCSRGKCARLRDSSNDDYSLEDVSCVPTTISNILLQKCTNKSCHLSYPVLDGGMCQLPYVNRKVLSQRRLLSEADPTFCVEIKPKQGWISHSQLHQTKCTFCLNQYLKLSNGAISRISQYCPLDLFSGDSIRMKKAIRALLQTPQNNLKIFKDGHLVYSDENSQNPDAMLQQWLVPSLPSSAEYSSLIDRFSALVHHALMTDLLGPVNNDPLDDQYAPWNCSSFRRPSLHNSSEEKFEPCDQSSQLLPKNCILDRILRIQKLQQYDTEFINRMLRQYSGDDDYDYVGTMLDRETNKLCLNPVQRYLLATTAKDCSILIAFQCLRTNIPVPAEHLVVDTASGAQYMFNIGVSDLDPKPLSCVEKHRKRDADIQNAWSSHIMQ